MQPSEAPGARPLDITSKIALTLRQMGIPGLPRNYELFYEAYTGTNQALIADIIDLGTRATQEKLDIIGARHLGRGRGEEVVENARNEIAGKIDEVMLLLLKERKSLENYGKFLNETSSGIGDRAMLTKELLAKIVGVMATATGTTIDHGRQIARSMADKSAELEKVKSTLEEYKRLADTDPLTQIRNRRAFDSALAAVYEIGSAPSYGALVVADIDDFKRINDRHGHPTGDRIIQSVAAMLQAIVPQDVFVARTGGEEFALIVRSNSEPAVAELADQVRMAVEHGEYTSLQTGEPCGSITVSMGVCMASEAETPDDLYAKADRALYASKVGGRNRVTLHSSLTRGEFRKGWMLYKND
ncbi:MAG: GGDEF domain-containing protein [Rhizobiales bacterium 65-79]|jgi:diguanylate cyclase|nr:diguanylate cyclase [Hyphomicrobiales bacterium]OJU02250.1 MAG: GGDEF domain-containing protein [Rhizobiales bacterium 65-79]